MVCLFFGFVCFRWLRRGLCFGSGSSGLVRRFLLGFRLLGGFFLGSFCRERGGLNSGGGADGFREGIAVGIYFRGYSCRF